MNTPNQALRAIMKTASTFVALSAFALAAGSPAQAASVSNGKVLSDAHNCAACHGAHLNNPISPEYPKLAGQHADYVFWALRQYQMGTSNPHLGRNIAIMAAQVQNLSPSDMKDIAAYIESLKSDLVQKR